ncbi:hypothetical protein P3T76_001625 [Phytophthora citrophthora]|uniref:Uncharacterized protein n=1 Tax=Phytophthora citrophthora TaxID=4793 RepID=A0AAD9LRW9_9STRA|nr:hypothetical protein P3T76_001625 [Phytophthora citrophthora]
MPLQSRYFRFGSLKLVLGMIMDLMKRRTFLTRLAQQLLKLPSSKILEGVIVTHLDGFSFMLRCLLESSHIVPTLSDVYKCPRSVQEWREQCMMFSIAATRGNELLTTTLVTGLQLMITVDKRLKR